MTKASAKPACPAASTLCSEERVGQLTEASGKGGLGIRWTGQLAVVAAPGNKPAKPRSYLEIEITPLRVSVFERSGDGKTAELLEALSRYGLRLEARVSSPCG